MRIGVLELRQLETEQPSHWINMRLAEQLVGWRPNGKAACRELAPRGRQRFIKILVAESFREIKDRFRSLPHVKLVPKINPIGYDVMCLQSYPEPNRETTRHPHEAFLKLCQQARQLGKTAVVADSVNA